MQKYIKTPLKIGSVVIIHTMIFLNIPALTDVFSYKTTEFSFFESDRSKWDI